MAGAKRPRRSPKRFLAPLALIVAVLAIALITKQTVGFGSSGGAAATVASTDLSQLGKLTSTMVDGTLHVRGDHRHPGKHAPATTVTGVPDTDGSGSGSATGATTTGTTTTAAAVYTVQAGDLFGTISAKTGVSVASLEKLNPKVSPTSLHVGQVLKLR